MTDEESEAKRLIEEELQTYIDRDAGVIKAQERLSANKDEASVRRLKEDKEKAIEKARDGFYKQHPDARQGIVGPAHAAKLATGKKRTFPG